MKTKTQKALEDAHDTIRQLRNELARAAEPLRQQIRELQAQLAQSERRARQEGLRALVLSGENVIRDRLIEALMAYRRLPPVATGKSDKSDKDNL